mmetsp:Transcript_8188/g.24344  ORF Transcript_8188/g.24344 Transcript_8188/m.24344 type:complete len:218 (+) Transcript_8188:2776-3429(+)
MPTPLHGPSSNTLSKVSFGKPLATASGRRPSSSGCGTCPRDRHSFNLRSRRLRTLSAASWRAGGESPCSTPTSAASSAAASSATGAPSAFPATARGTFCSTTSALPPPPEMVSARAGCCTARVESMRYAEIQVTLNSWAIALMPPTLLSDRSRAAMEPVLRMSSAMATVFPPGAAHMSTTIDPGSGATTWAVTMLGKFCSIISPGRRPLHDGVANTR